MQELDVLEERAEHEEDGDKQTKDYFFKCASAANS